MSKEDKLRAAHARIVQGQPTWARESTLRMFHAALAIINEEEEIVCYHCEAVNVVGGEA